LHGLSAMYAFAKLVVLFSVFLSVTAIPSHYGRDARAHHALAARRSPFELVREPVPIVAPPRVLRKRSSGNCIPRNGTSSAQAPPASSSNAAPHSTSDVASSSASNSPSPPPSSSPSPSPSPSPLAITPASALLRPTTSQTPPPATTPSSGGGGGGGQTFSGDGTFYATGLGACGITNVDTDFIAAVAESQFDSFPGYNGVNPNTNPICGKKALVNYQGKTVTVTITDRCTGCAFGALDFSPSAFLTLAAFSVGRIFGITWSFV